MRALTPLLALFAIPVFAGPLNDTGATQCYNGSTLVACDASSTGDAASHPRQDGRFGRDPQAGANQLTKTGGGAAGFDFTKIANNGTELPATSGMGSNPGDWACIRDNVTGLIWEVKVNDTNHLRHQGWTYTWYNGTTGYADPGAGSGSNNCANTARCDTDKFVTDVNSAGLCGANDWRLPTRRELLSIVHHGVSNPSIDTSYFPNTVIGWYWSSDHFAPISALAWFVDFVDGYSNAGDHVNDHHVRLVRSGQ